MRWVVNPTPAEPRLGPRGRSDHPTRKLVFLFSLVSSLHKLNINFNQIPLNYAVIISQGVVPKPKFIIKNEL